MRALLLVVLFLAACSNQPNTAASPSPSASLAPAPPAALTSAPAFSPTATPISLPSEAQLSAPSANVVWTIVGGQHLFRSVDRGDSWEERPFRPQLINASIAFVSDREGFVLSAGPAATQCQFQLVTVFHITDAGATWEQLPATGIADGMCKRGITSSDATHSFFTAQSPNAPPVIYRTSDGGQTWQASTPLPDPPGVTSGGAGFVLTPGRARVFGSIALVDATFGGGQTRYIFRSTDGGASWKYASSAPSVEGTAAFVTAGRWLQIGAPGESKQTVDGGASWQPYPTNYSQAAPIGPDVVFADAMVGYATVRGSIQRTVDGGGQWTAIKTPGT